MAFTKQTWHTAWPTEAQAKKIREKMKVKQEARKAATGKKSPPPIPGK